MPRRVEAEKRVSAVPAAHDVKICQATRGAADKSWPEATKL